MLLQDLLKKKMTWYYLKFLVAEWVLELLIFTPHIVSASFNMTVYENLKLRKKVEANKGLTKDSTERGSLLSTKSQRSNAPVPRI